MMESRKEPFKFWLIIGEKELLLFDILNFLMLEEVLHLIEKEYALALRAMTYSPKILS